MLLTIPLSLIYAIPLDKIHESCSFNDSKKKSYYLLISINISLTIHKVCRANNEIERMVNIYITRDLRRISIE